jgi:signal peptidase I
MRDENSPENQEKANGKPGSTPEEEPVSERELFGRRRVWWLAGVFSYLVPGLGQVYNGRAARGFLCYALFGVWSSLLLVIALRAMQFAYSTLNVLLLFLFLFAGLAGLIAIIIDAMRLARRRKGPFRLRAYNRWYIYLAAVLIYQGADWTVKGSLGRLVIRPYKIPTSSMEPTLRPGDFVLSNQIYFCSKNPARGDVVIFRHPENPDVQMIKRIIGLPGDTLGISKKQVWVNGDMLSEDYVFHSDPEILPADRSSRDFFGPLIVPANRYFMMGDNRDSSSDSRFYGSVDRNAFQGRPSLIYMSLDTSLPWWNVIGRWISIRFSRIGKRIE